MSYGTSQPHIASYVLLKQDGKHAFVLRGENQVDAGLLRLTVGEN